MTKDKTITHDELRPEYDLRKLRVRKFGPARKQFGNFVKLEPDVAWAFPDAASVNEALRFLIRVSKENSPARLSWMTTLNIRHQSTIGQNTISLLDRI